MSTFLQIKFLYFNFFISENHTIKQICLIDKANHHVNHQEFDIDFPKMNTVFNNQKPVKFHKENLLLRKVSYFQLQLFLGMRSITKRFKDFV